MKEKRVSKRIFLFYRWGMRIVPILLMLAHWVYINISNKLPEADTTIDSGYHIAPLYIMTYVFPMVFMLPASYFFKLCTIWRIPFLYLAGVNVLHLYNASFVCTAPIAEQCRVLMYAIFFVYTLCIAQKLSKV